MSSGYDDKNIIDLSELYKQIKNPINDLEIIKKLIVAYSKSSGDSERFYSQLISINPKEYNDGRYYPKDSNKFYAMMFNKWKNSIVNMTRNEFIELYETGYLGYDFYEMRKYLKNISDVSTTEEANEIFFGNKNKIELENALKKYRWNYFGAASTWVHVCSKYLTAWKDEYPNIEHRLYLNFESLDIYKIITLFVEKCDEKHLPYYFKFDQWGKRDDSIVIYSSTEDLIKYIEILQEMKNDSFELISKAKNPSILTGKIDNWIGYGSEPERSKDGEARSFNEIRSKAITFAINQTTKKWILDNIDRKVQYNGQMLNFQNYIAMKVTEKVINDLEEKIIRNDKERNYDFINKLDYNLKDINNSQTKQRIYKAMENNISPYLTKIFDEENIPENLFFIDVLPNKQIHIDNFYLKKIITEISPNIMRNDPNFSSLVKLQIQDNSSDFGIDKEKFCFDINIKNKLVLSPEFFAEQENDKKVVRTRK